MPRKTQPGSKAYPDDSMIYSGPPIKEKETPADYPSVINLKKWAELADLTYIAGFSGADSFLLNAKETSVKNKVILTSLNSGTYNDKTIPYYIPFWKGYFMENMNNKTKWVKISFDKNYIPVGAQIIIRLGGYAGLYGGATFDVEFEGRKFTVPHTAGFSQYQAVVIPVTINGGGPNTNRTKPLGDIKISADLLASWYFFDAHYDSRVKLLKK